MPEGACRIDKWYFFILFKYVRWLDWCSKTLVCYSHHKAQISVSRFIFLFILRRGRIGWCGGSFCLRRGDVKLGDSGNTRMKTLCRKLSLIQLSYWPKQFSVPWNFIETYRVRFCFRVKWVCNLWMLRKIICAS